MVADRHSLISRRFPIEEKAIKAVWRLIIHAKLLSSHINVSKYIIGEASLAARDYSIPGLGEACYTWKIYSGFCWPSFAWLVMKAASVGKVRLKE